MPAMVTIGGRLYVCATNGPRGAERLAEDGSGFVKDMEITFRITRSKFTTATMPGKGTLVTYKNSAGTAEEWRVEDFADRPHEPALVLRCVRKKGAK